ncbi:tmem65 [Symbiodinium necroappetens]|uniref:Tmem65 protein n=1 Tax=Symbiodinium necroappetens TaxID=1628268 RepID=A0A812TAV6_9DINO|nr:tmem65 [Symbiodinium necroappetens]
MIVFGDFIDSTLCVALNFSTMAAAAIGNTLSDGAGIWSGQWLEARAKSLGFEEPKLSEEQEEMGVTVRWRNVGQFVGITVGCILGCCPLLWMDPEAAIKQRREKEREEAFEIVVSKVQELLQAEAVSLLLLNKERDELIASHQTKNLPEHFHWKLDEGFIGHVVSTGHFINVADIKDEAQYNPEIHDNFLKTGIKVQSILCMPIFRGGEVHGVVSVVNKKKNHGAFTQKDEDLLSAICSHVSVALIDDKQTFKEAPHANVIEQCEKSMQTTGSPEFTSAASQRMATLFVPALEGLRTVLGAEAEGSQELFSEAPLPVGRGGEDVIDGPLPHHTAPVGLRVGAAGEAVQVGHYMNVPQTETTGSELAVPLFDTSRKCLGAIKCVNKQGSSAFNTEDVEFVTQVAHYMGMLLEGPDAGLRRVLASTRQKMQTKAAMQAADAKGTIVCNLVKATSLPSASKRKVIDPYVTFSIARSNPLQQEPGVEQRVMRVRNKDRKAAIRRFAKSGTILEEWLQRPEPGNYGILRSLLGLLGVAPSGVPEEELWVHVLLWDYDSLRNDELVAHAAFSLSEIRAGKLKEVAAHGLRPLPGTGQASSEAPVLGPDKQIATLWAWLSRKQGL